MNFKRIGMTLVSLLLVCCLLVNVSPIKAEATSAALTATVVSVPGIAVIGACLVGLGVLVGVATTDWDAVVDNAVDYYTEQGVIDSDGNMDIYSLTNAGYQYGIAEDVLTGLKDWLFDNEVITETVSIGGTLAFDGISISAGTPMRLAFTDDSTEVWYSDVPVVFYGGYYDNLYTDNVQRNYSLSIYIVSDCEFKLYNQYSEYLSGNIKSIDIDGSTYYYYSTGGNTITSTDAKWYTNFCEIKPSCYEFSNSSEMAAFTISACLTGSVLTETITNTVNGDLIMGEIASAADSIAAGYTTWAENYVDLSVLDPDLPSAVYPIAYSASQTLDDIHSLTQEEVWAGVLSGVTLPDEDVTTEPDVGDISIALGDVTTSVFLNSLADLIETLPLIPPNIEDAIEQLPIYVGDIRDYIETLPQWQDTLTDHIEQLPGQIADIRDFIETLPIWQDNILNHIETFPDKLSLAFDDVKVGVKSIADTLTESLTATKAIALERVDAITEAITGVFVPSEGYIDAKVEALALEFPIVESIQATGDDLKEFMLGLGQRPPIIYIDLGAQRGFHDIGGKVAFIDLTWYAEYKPTMDAILSAFLWLWFAWRMFLSAPGILQGASGVWQRYESHAGKDAASFKANIPTDDNPKYITPFGWDKENGWHNFPQIRNPNYKRK